MTGDADIEILERLYAHHDDLARALGLDSA